MRKLRLATATLLGVGVGMSASCGSIQLGGNAVAVEPRVIASEKAELVLEPVVLGLEHPWSLAFLPDGSMLVTERPGRLRLVDGDGRLEAEAIANVPVAFARGQGGLLDVVPHPDFEASRLVYLSYAALEGTGAATKVARGRLADGALEDVEVIFESNGRTTSGQHFGSRLAFGPDGHLYVTLGDRGERELAQDMANHAGSVVRLADDGAIPADNPFVDRAGAASEIFSFGHRNAQGLAVRPGTDQIWLHEHGPRGGDELNLLVAGGNYGWPVVSQGREYASGRPVGVMQQEGMLPAGYVWDPSIAPSGMAFYDAETIPEWQGNLLVGALAFQLLARLELDGDRVVHEERLLERTIGRIRDVRVGPDGNVYILTDESDGGIYRLRPADGS